jgi:hypothetical protein
MQYCDLLAELGPPAEQVRVLDAIRRVDTLVVDDVLEAVGDHYGVKAVAKAARRAAFKRRSSGRR